MYRPENVVPVDPAVHSSLKLGPVTSHVFASQVHAVPLASSEFGNAAREYPIVFLKHEDGSFAPTAMLGFRVAENLFVNAEGRWDARYIPFFVRRYPFLTVEISETDAAVCVDEIALPGLESTDGLALFDNNEPTEKLKEIAEALFSYRDECKRAAEWCAEVAKLDLFKQVSASANLVDGSGVKMDGMWVVDDEKLRTVPANVAHDWLRNGILPLIHAHLLSLGNLQVLAERVAARGPLAA